MAIPPEKNKPNISSWVFSRLKSLLNSGWTFRRHSRGATSSARLLVTELEDRVTPTTLLWLGSSAANGNLWSVASNWLEDQAPVSGDRLVFDSAIPKFSAATNGFAPTNDISGLTDLTIEINNSSSAGDFTISGDSFGLITAAGIGITCTLATGSSSAEAIDNNITLGADTTVDVGLGSLTLGGTISGGYSLTAAGSPSSTLTLNAANTYSGGTVLTSGTVAVNTNTSLGSGTLTLNGGTLSDAASFLQVPNSFVVAAPSTIGGGGFFNLDGNGTLNATLSLDNSGFLTLNGALSGAGGLSEIGFPGGTTLGGTAPNTFTGGLSIVFGGITLNKTPGVNAVVSPITLVGSFTSLTLNASNQINDNATVYLGLGSTLDTNGFSDTVASLTGLGGVNTGLTAAAGLTVTGGGSQVLTGAVSGSGLLTYDGSGSLTLAGASSSYSGTLTAAGGALTIDADFSGASAKVAGGTLGGSGIVESITATSGYVNPATVGAGGTLDTASKAAASSLNGATFSAGLASGGPSGQLALGANATLNLSGANLSLNVIGSTFAAAYQIITSPTGGLSGNFNSLPNGSTISVGGQTFQINYSPYAVTLTNQGSGSTTLHWTVQAGSDWSVAGNWEENTAPASGDTLVFDTSSPGFAATSAAFAPVNDVSGLTNIAIVINDNWAAGNFVISGDGLGLVATAGVGIASTLAAGSTATIDNPLTLAAGTTVDMGLGTLTLAGSIGGGSSLIVAGSPDGTLTLNSKNSYTGGTVLTSGTVEVNTDTSLGTGTITFDGGTLANATAFLDVANPFVVSTLSTIGGGSFFNIDGNGVLNANLRLTNSGFLTLSGAISGTGGLIEDGFPGNSILAGTAANTYTGPTIVISGDLELDKSAGVKAVVSPVISLAGGSFPTLSWGANDQLNGGVSVSLGADSSLSTGGYADTLDSLTGIGGVDDSSTTGSGLTVTGSGAMLLTGTVSGSGLLNYNGTGSLTLGGASSSFSGQLDAQAGTLLVDADFSGATAIAQGSGTLGGTGIVKDFPSTGSGTLNPGGSEVGGILTTAAASVSSAISGETFQVDIADNALSDELVIGESATINLANSTLSVNVLHSTYGTVYTIIASPTGGISGTFIGLSNGSTFAVAGGQFMINYTATAVTLTDLQAISLPANLPEADAGVAYDQTITPTGGVPPVTLSVSNITNPDGLTISGSGTSAVSIAGVPTSSGTVAFTVTPSDANGPESSTNYSIVVNAPVVLTPASLPDGEIGIPYSQSITFTGGTAPVTLAVSKATNTTGLTISGSETGAISISGTPTSAGTVTFTVTPTDAYGTGSGQVYSFDVNFPAPVISLISPSAGSVVGGTTVTITGSNLAAAGVTFGGVAATIDSDGSGQIVVTTPAGTAGNQPVIVSTPGGTANGSFTYVAVPAVTGVSPYFGPIAGGTLVTITGTALADATQVLFGTDPAVISSDSATQITAISPAEAAGAVDITVTTTASGTSVTSAADQFLYVSPADSTTSTVSLTANTAASGSTITVTLQSKDSSGTDLTTGGAIVTFALGGTTGGGRGTFSSVTDNQNGTYSATFTGTIAGGNTITATLNGQPVTSGSPSITVTPGPLSLAKSVVKLGSTTDAAGTADTVTLQAEDAAGNDLTTGGLSVAFALGTGSSGQGTFGPVLDNGNGMYTASFSGNLAGTYAVTAAIGGQPVTSTAPSVTVTPGAIDPANSVVTVLPSSVAAGSGTAITLQTRDIYGNNLTTGGAAITFGLGSGVGQGTFGPITDKGNGTYTATFTGTTAGGNTVTATVDGQAVTATLASVTVMPGLAGAANSTVTLASGTVSSGGTDTVTLQAVDAYGNDLTTGGAIVAFGLGSGAGQCTFGTVTDNQNGTYTATFTGTIAGGNTITAIINGQPVTTFAPAITVTPGAIAPSNAVVTMSTNTVAAGSVITVTVYTRDAAGNDLTTGGAVVVPSLRAGAGQGMFGTVTDNGNGTYTATFTGTTAGGNTITAAVNGTAAATQAPSVTVAPGPVDAATSLVTVSAATVAAGSGLTVTLYARDAYDNIVDGATVAFQLGGGTGEGSFGPVTDNGNGAYTAAFTGTTAGANTITAAANGTAAATQAPSVTVTPGPVDAATSLVTVSAATVAAGSGLTVTLHARDAYDNALSVGGAPVAFQLGGGTGDGIIGPVTDNGNGTYVATFTGTTAGANTITAAVNFTAVATQAPSVTVAPGPVDAATSLVTVSAGTVAAGGGLTVTLYARDAYDNALSVGGATVAFQTGFGMGEGTFGPVTDNGDGTYTATFTGTAAGENTITATVNGAAVGTAASSVTVTAGPVATAESGAFLAAGWVAAGSTDYMTIGLTDAYGNPVSTGFTPTLSLESGGGGQGTFGTVVNDGGGTYTVPFTGTIAGVNSIVVNIGGGSLTPEPVTVTPGPASLDKTMVSLSATAVQLGGEATITLQAADAYGNDLTTGGLAVKFGLSGPGTLSAVTDHQNGTYTATVLGKADGTISITAAVGGQPVPLPTPLTLFVSEASASGAMSKLSLSSPSVAAGGTTTVTLQAKNAQGNPETAGGLMVTFELTSAKGGKGTFAPAIDNGNGTYTATFTCTVAGTNAIAAVIGGINGSPKPVSVQVTPGPLSWSTSKVTVSSATVNAGSKVTLTLQPEDAYGNKVTVTAPGLLAFTQSGTGSGTLGAVKYNPNGTYTATFTGQTAGAVTIGATIEGSPATSPQAAVTVVPGSVSAARSTLTLSAASVAVGGAISITLQAVDAYGNDLTTGGLKVAFKLGTGSGKGKFGKVTYAGNGQYEVQFTRTAAGTNSVIATIGGEQVKVAPTITVS